MYLNEDNILNGVYNGEVDWIIPSIYLKTLEEFLYRYTYMYMSYRKLHTVTYM